MFRMRYFSNGRYFLIPFLLLLAISALAGCDNNNFGLGDSSDIDGSGVDGDSDFGNLDFLDDNFDGPGWEVPPKKVAVYYQSDASDSSATGFMYANIVESILGHFAVAVSVQNIEDYKAGDVSHFDAIVFIGSAESQAPSANFANDIYNRPELPVYWFGFHMDRFSASSFNMTQRFGFRVSQIVDGETYEFVNYKNAELTRDPTDNYFVGVEIADENKCQMTAYMENNVELRPYLLECGNFFYCSTIPFSYMENDIYVFTDSLHDFLRTDQEENHRALVRFEDINSVTADQALLRKLADKLADLDVPFSVGVIPVYSDPKGEWLDPGSVVYMKDNPSFLQTLAYMHQKGGTLIVHGYTHQYDGVTAVDYEFWDEAADEPLFEDDFDWAQERAKMAADEFGASFQYRPIVWETPHYEASYVDYFAFASIFPVLYEQIRFFDTREAVASGSSPDSDLTYADLRSPYALFSTSYGSMLLPENMGYLDPTEPDENGVPQSPEGKAYYAEQLLSVRDGVASFFFHHWQPEQDILDTIQGIKDAGYTFVSPRDLLNEGPPAYKSGGYVADGDTTDGDTTDGDVDIIPQACTYGPAACPWGLGCHNGFCGQCTSNSECRPLDACNPNGTCGECSDDAPCREGETCRYGFCMDTVISEMNIIMDPNDVDELLADENQFEEFVYPGRVEVDGKRFDSPVEVRLFGKSSRAYPKRSIRVEFPEDSDHPGFSRKINLKADYNDPAFMRSTISYETVRRLTNVPTPRSRYRKLYINGEYYGLMTEIERIGEKFLELNGRDRLQSLYEVNEQFDSGALVACPDMDTYIKYYQKKAGDRSDYSDLLQLIEEDLWTDYESSPSWTVTDTTNARRVVDIDHYLPLYASQVLTQNIDLVASNFHFSWQKQDSGQMAWEFYPWDMDISFGCRWVSDEELALCLELYSDDWYLVGILYEGDPDPEYPNMVWMNMLLHLLLNDSGFRSQYENLICEYLRSDWWNVRIFNFIDAIHDTIVDAVDEDERDLNSDISEFEDALDGIRDFIPSRIEFLENPNEMGCY